MEKDKRNKIIIAVLAVLIVAVVAVIIVVAANKNDSTGGVQVIEVTDENGEVVTDANGNPVTEPVDIEDEGEAADDTTGSNAQAATTQAGGGSGSGGSGNGGSGSDTTTAPEKTEPKTTTEPKKRDVSVTVKLPYKNDEASQLTVVYRPTGETEYIKLDPIDVKLNGEEITVDLGSCKGAVKVVVYLRGVDIAPDSNVGTIGSAYDNVIIEPAIGITVADGGWD